MSLGIAGAIAAATAAAAVVLSLALRDVRGDVRLAHPDAPALADAGWVGGMRRWECMRLALVVASFLLALLLGLPVVLAGVGAVAPSVWARVRAEAARDRARRSFGRVVSSMGSGLRSGLSLPDALRRAVDASSDPLAARPLAEALRAFELGAGLHAALAAEAVRCRDERARVALGSLALGIAERLPRERLADLMVSVADRVAFEDQLEDEVRARASGARQQQWLLAAVVPALAAYLSFTMPALAATLGSDLGRLVLVPSALALEVIGIVLGRRIVRGALR